MKKLLLVFGLFLFSMVLMFGCTTPDKIQPNPEDTNVIVNANNQFSMDLYSKYKSNEENIFFSPYSISSALAMTYEGARGQTANEIISVFHFPENKTTLRNGNLGMYNSINQGNNEYTLKTANALWGQNDYAFENTYLKNVETYYNGYLTNLDFNNDPSGSADTINTWCDEQTNGKIDKIITAGDITPLTTLILTNAIYFKGTWEYEFNSDSTSKRNFYSSQNRTVQADMMFMGEKKFNYTEDEEAQILEMLYKGKEISMLIILPKEGKLNEVENSLTLDKIDEWKSKLNTEEISELYLPKFKFETEYKMRNDLIEMGMGNAFSSIYADFSGMTMENKKELFISQVIHKTYIEVDEKGTEAAAATAVSMVRNATAPDPDAIVFNANHLFIFVIQDTETGNILFMGRINDPIIK